MLPWEWLARRRILNGFVSLGQQVAEVPGAHPGGGQRGGGSAGFPHVGGFPVGEPKDLVPPVELIAEIDGAADRESILMALKGRFVPVWRVEVILRIQGLVAHEVERRSMQVVGAGLGGDVYHGAHGAAVLCRICIGLHLELLDSVDGRLHHFGLPLGAGKLDAVVVHAVKQEVVLRHAHSADAETAVAATGERLHGASRKESKLVVVAAV